MDKEFLFGTEKTSVPKSINEGEKAPRYAMGKLPKVEQTKAPKIINEVKFASDLYKTEDILKARIETTRGCAPKLKMQSSTLAMEALPKQTLARLSEKYDMSKRCVADVMGEIPELKVYVDIPNLPDLERCFRQK